MSGDIDTISNKRDIRKNCVLVKCWNGFRLQPYSLSLCMVNSQGHVSPKHEIKFLDLAFTPMLSLERSDLTMKKPFLLGISSLFHFCLGYHVGSIEWTIRTIHAFASENDSIKCVW